MGTSLRPHPASSETMGSALMIAGGGEKGERKGGRGGGEEYLGMIQLIGSQSESAYSVLRAIPSGEETVARDAPRAGPPEHLCSVEKHDSIHAPSASVQSY